MIVIRYQRLGARVASKYTKRNKNNVCISHVYLVKGNLPDLNLLRNLLRADAVFVKLNFTYSTSLTSRGLRGRENTQ